MFASVKYRDWTSDYKTMQREKLNHIQHMTAACFLPAACSFGIMLWQLYTASVPYAGMRYAEIVYQVAVCNMRPTFPPETPQSYKELAELCWQSDAMARPSFEQVNQTKWKDHNI